MTQFGDQFGKAEIQEIQAMSKRVVDKVLAQEERQEEATDGTLDAEFLTKKQRERRAAVSLQDPVSLGAWHDDMAFESGLTPERPISRKWLKMVIGMTKELRDA